MMMNASFGSIGFEKHEHKAQSTESDVKLKREQEGQCGECGNIVFEVKKGWLFGRVKEKIPKDNELAKNGRCLLCHPLIFAEMARSSWNSDFESASASPVIGQSEKASSNASSLKDIGKNVAETAKATVLGSPGAPPLPSPTDVSVKASEATSPGVSASAPLVPAQVAATTVFTSLPPSSPPDSKFSEEINALAKASTPKLLTNALDAVFSIAYEIESREQLVKEGVLPHLCRVMLDKEVSTAAKKTTLIMFSNLALTDEVRGDLYECGFLNVLSALLLDGGNQIDLVTCSRILCNLTCNDKLKASLVDGGLLPLLLNICGMSAGTTGVTQENCMTAILNLVVSNKLRDKVFNAGVVPACLEVMRGGTKGAKSSAFLVICNFAFEDGLRRGLIEANVVSPTLLLLQDGAVTPHIYTCALNAICNLCLASDVNVYPVLLTCGVAPPLIAIINRRLTDETVSETDVSNAQMALRSLCKDEQCRSAIKALGVKSSAIKWRDGAF